MRDIRGAKTPRLQSLKRQLQTELNHLLNTHRSNLVARQIEHKQAQLAEIDQELKGRAQQAQFDRMERNDRRHNNR